MAESKLDQTFHNIWTRDGGQKSQCNRCGEIVSSLQDILAHRCPNWEPSPDGYEKIIADYQHHLRKDREEARIQLDQLLQVIREVHSAHADDLCWMDIDKIFLAAGLPVPDRKVGDKEAMLGSCRRYVETMCAGGGWKSYEELEKELEESRRECVNWQESYRELEQELTRAMRTVLDPLG